MKRFTILFAVVVTALIVGACNPVATPTQVPTATAGPTATATEGATATPAPTPVAVVPSDQLVLAGHLVACIDIPYPPQEFFDDQGNPTGADPDLGAEIASRLGLAFRVENTVFDFIIEAVNAGKCDIIISAQNINPERTAQVDMIPYFKAGQSFVVLKGNPDAIQAELDLCGKEVAAETGTTEVNYLEGSGDYAASGGLKKLCSDAGKAAPVAVQFQKDSDALLALQAKQVSAYFADSPVAGYYTVQQPTSFELAPIPPLDAITEGISVAKGKDGLLAAVKAALLSMMGDGTYLATLTKYGLQDGALVAADVVVNQP
jgi:polar amino acid transport system substrate-binding protein